MPSHSLRKISSKIFNKILNRIKKIKILDYLKNSLPPNDTYYIFFSFYSIVAYFTMIYAIPNDILAVHISFCNCIEYIGIAISAIFLTLPFWPIFFKKQLFWIWPISIIYNLAFSSLSLAFVGNLSMTSIIVVLLNLIVISMLTDIIIISLFAKSIFTAAVIAVKIGTNINPWTIITKNFKFEVIYILIIMIATFFIIKKHKK